MESKGRIPDSIWLERSISVTAPFELQVIPLKLQTELVAFHELKTGEFDDF